MATNEPFPSEVTQEEARLAAVRRYEILDTPPDGAFDRIASLAAQLLQTPIAIVSIVDVDRIWFKSHHGIDINEVTRNPGLCASAIIHDEAWVVENALIDPRALANPLVAGEFGLRAYAGAQLRTQDGHNLGTLCVIDKTPRKFTQEQIDILEALADVVVRELEVRLAARRAVLATTAELDRRQEVAILDGDSAVALTSREREVLEALSQGLTNREIATRLAVSYPTIKSHVRSLYRKLDTRNRVQAAGFADQFSRGRGKAGLGRGVRYRESSI